MPIIYSKTLEISIKHFPYFAEMNYYNIKGVP